MVIQDPPSTLPKLGLTEVMTGGTLRVFLAAFTTTRNDDLEQKTAKKKTRMKLKRGETARE
jgi:hypothetical protein